MMSVLFLSIWPCASLDGGASPSKRPVLSIDPNPLEFNPSSLELKLLDTSSLPFLLLISAAFSATSEMSEPMRVVKLATLGLPILDEKDPTVESLPLVRMIMLSDLSLGERCHPRFVCCNSLEWEVWDNRNGGRGDTDSGLVFLI